MPIKKSIGIKIIRCNYVTDAKIIQVLKNKRYLIFHLRWQICSRIGKNIIHFIPLYIDLYLFQIVDLISTQWLWMFCRNPPCSYLNYLKFGGVFYFYTNVLFLNIFNLKQIIALNLFRICIFKNTNTIVHFRFNYLSKGRCCWCGFLNYRYRLTNQHEKWAWPPCTLWLAVNKT